MSGFILPNTHRLEVIQYALLEKMKGLGPASLWDIKNVFDV